MKTSNAFQQSGRATGTNLRQIFAQRAKTSRKSFVSARRRGDPLPPSLFAPLSGQPISSNSPQFSKIRSIFDFRHLFVGASDPPPPEIGAGGKADGSRPIAGTRQPCVPALPPRATPRTRSTSTQPHLKLKNTFFPVFLYKQRKASTHSINLRAKQLAPPQVASCRISGSSRCAVSMRCAGLR